MDRDRAQILHRRRQALPDPTRQYLRSRILQTFDLIEIIVVELGVKRLPCLFDVGEVDQPAALFADLALDLDLNGIRMPVQAATFMPGRSIRQAMGGFEGELLL